MKALSVLIGVIVGALIIISVLVFQVGGPSFKLQPAAAGAFVTFDAKHENDFVSTLHEFAQENGFTLLRDDFGPGQLNIKLERKDGIFIRVIHDQQPNRHHIYIYSAVKTQSYGVAFG